MIAKLISRGVLATINQPLDPPVAIEVAKEFGSTATIMSFEEEAQQAAAVTAPQAAEEIAEEVPSGGEPCRGPG